MRRRRIAGERAQRPAVSQQAAADTVGVSVHTVRSWISCSRVRRPQPGMADLGDVVEVARLRREGVPFDRIPTRGPGVR